MLINLLYHDVTLSGQENSSGFPGPGSARYKLTPEEFQGHLSQIATVIQQPPLATILPDFPKSPNPGELPNPGKFGDQRSSPVPSPRPCGERVRVRGPLPCRYPELNQAGIPPFADGTNWTITFDDGGVSAFTEIADKLEQRGWRGWFFIATDFIGTPSFCSREQIQALHRRGHVIGSHSCSHPERISNCSWDQLVDEWSRSCRVLAEIIGQPVMTASVPGGFYSHDVARAASHAGIRVLFNSEPTTSPCRVEETLILGRYNVYRGMTAVDAASLVNSPLRRWRQTAFWNIKKVAKVLAGPVYKVVRHRILAREYTDQKTSNSPK